MARQRRRDRSRDHFFDSTGNDAAAVGPCDVVLRRLAGEQTPLYARLLEDLAAAGYPGQYSEDLDRIIWVKAGINCFCNLPSGLTRMSLQRMLRHPHGNALAEDIVDEVVRVAKAAGVNITAEEILAARTSALQAPGENFPSAYQDMLRKRKTEVDYLNGAVARIGRELGIPAPVNETIADLTHMVQDTYF